jgi:hypothetical protein
MPYFRCHMLDEHGDILFPADLTVDSVEAALRHACTILEAHNQGPAPSKRVYAFEVWNGDGRVFPKPPSKPSKFEELDRRSAALSANAKALRDAGENARERSVVLKEMSRTTRDAADQCRKLAVAARKRQEAR